VAGAGLGGAKRTPAKARRDPQVGDAVPAVRIPNWMNENAWSSLIKQAGLPKVMGGRELES